MHQDTTLRSETRSRALLPSIVSIWWTIVPAMVQPLERRRPISIHILSESGRYNEANTNPKMMCEWNPQYRQSKMKRLLHLRIVEAAVVNINMLVVELPFSLNNNRDIDIDKVGHGDGIAWSKTSDGIQQPVAGTNNKQTAC